MQQISSRMAKILERLAEMFPKSHYQSELDRYISSRRPQNAADVEHYTKEFEHRNLGRNFQ
jgi:predicted transcriptional regulator with HTH domain